MNWSDSHQDRRVQCLTGKGGRDTFQTHEQMNDCILIDNAATSANICQQRTDDLDVMAHPRSPDLSHWFGHCFFSLSNFCRGKTPPHNRDTIVKALRKWINLNTAFRGWKAHIEFWETDHKIYKHNKKSKHLGHPKHHFVTPNCIFFRFSSCNVSKLINSYIYVQYIIEAMDITNEAHSNNSHL